MNGKIKQADASYCSIAGRYHGTPTYDATISSKRPYLSRSVCVYVRLYVSAPLFPRTGAELSARLLASGQLLLYVVTDADFDALLYVSAKLNWT